MKAVPSRLEQLRMPKVSVHAGVLSQDTDIAIETADIIILSTRLDTLHCDSSTSPEMTDKSRGPDDIRSLDLAR
jgi:hypothetical protein